MPDRLNNHEYGHVFGRSNASYIYLMLLPGGPPATQSIDVNICLTISLCLEVQSKTHTGRQAGSNGREERLLRQ
jgi:hypothetical protein